MVPIVIFFIFQSAITFGSSAQELFNQWNKDLVQEFVSIQKELLENHEDQKNKKDYHQTISCSEMKFKDTMKSLHSALVSDNVILQIKEAIEYLDQEYKEYNFDLDGPGRYFLVIQAKKRIDDVIYIGIGDAHTDIGTLYDVVKDDINDNLTLQNDKKQFIFLGDCIDRGPTSLLAFLFLLVLKYKNPNNVVYMRGNHETDEISYTYGLHHELVLLYGKHNFNSVYSAIKKYFKRLPVAVFLCDIKKNIDVKESENNIKTDVALYSHGLFDTEYDPSKLFEKLKSDQQNENYYEAFNMYSGNSNFLSGNFKPGNFEFPGDYYEDQHNQKEEDKNSLTSSDIIKYAKKYNINHFFCAHQHTPKYEKLSPYYCANCFNACFNLGPIDDKNNSIFLIRHGLCCGSPYAFPALENYPHHAALTGFIFTSITHFYKKIYLEILKIEKIKNSKDKKISTSKTISKDIVDIIVLPNTETTTERSRQLFVEIYANYLQKHFIEDDFPIEPLNPFDGDCVISPFIEHQNNNPTRLKSAIFNYLLLLFMNYAIEKELFKKDEQCKTEENETGERVLYLKEATEEPLKDFLLNWYVTVPEKRIVMQYDYEGYIHIPSHENNTLNLLEK